MDADAIGSQHAQEGKTVNGFTDKNGVTINIDSQKALGSVIGNEITHVLEGSDLYDSMTDIVFQMAKELGEYDSRLADIQKLYDADTDVQKELAADLIGDYLFRDEAFVRSLSAKNPNLFLRVRDEIKHLYKLATAGSKEARALEKLKHTFEKVYRETKAQTPDGTKYSISSIVGDSGKDYGVGVVLDSNLLTGLTYSERKKMVKLVVVEELAGNTFVAYDGNNNPVEISLAEKNEKNKTKNGKKPVLKERYHKNIDNKTKQESVVLADELISASQYDSSNPAKHPHDWLDNNGQNQWDERKVYIQDKNKTVWEATLHIANSADGRKILYDIDPIKKVEGARKSAPTTTTTTNVPQNDPDVNTQFSLSPSSEADTGTGLLEAPVNQAALQSPAGKKVLAQDLLAHSFALSKLYLVSDSSSSL